MCLVCIHGPVYIVCTLLSHNLNKALYFKHCVVPHELEILSRFLEILVNLSEESGLNCLKIFYFHTVKNIFEIVVILVFTSSKKITETPFKTASKH